MTTDQPDTIQTDNASLSTAERRGRAADALDTCRHHLRRAYLLTSWGKLDDALDACDRADDATGPDGHPMPGALRGSILVAAGRLGPALRELRRVTRRWSDFALGHVYFAEACLLDGRTRQGRLALDRARSADDGTHADFIDALERVLDAPPDLSSLPLVVPAAPPVTER